MVSPRSVHPMTGLPVHERQCPIRRTALILAVALWVSGGLGLAEDFTLVTLDPGHFHAALFQREMLAGVAEEAFVYAPLGPDVLAHLSRVASLNARPDQPTHWRLRVYTGPDFEARMLAERAGQIVVMSGRNRGKIERIQRCVRAGLHVLADKPWVIGEVDLPTLRAVLDEAEARGVVVYDAMTQRFEVTARVQRALVNDPGVFGTVLPGSLAEPAVTIESLHFLLKEVGGVPNRRPPWFFDVAEQGEGLTDVGTHLVDMVAWVLFPDTAIDDEREVQVLRGRRWPTPLTLAEFQRVTGLAAFPGTLQPSLIGGRFDYYCNNAVDYILRGVHVRLETTWEFAAAPGRQDTERVVFRGSRARVEVRQDPEDQYRREVYVVPNEAADAAAVQAAVERRLAVLVVEFPGLAVERSASHLQVLIPERVRLGHEEHFARVVQRFLEYARNPRTLPAWEKPNLLAKYRITTRGVALAREDATRPEMKPCQTP